MTMVPLWILLLPLLVSPSFADGQRRHTSSSSYDAQTLSPSHTHGTTLSDYTKLPEGLTVPPPSPRCWTSALRLLQTFDATLESSLSHDTTKHHSAHSAHHLCSNLPEESQKLLALEIARCHLTDLGKPLIEDDNVLRQCVLHPRGDDAPEQQSPSDQDTAESKQEQDDDDDDTTPHLLWCLQHLTDAGVHAYTHYVAYVQQLCIRLTQEAIMAVQHQTHYELTTRYMQASVLASTQLEAIHDSLELHGTQMEQLTRLPQQLTQLLSKELQETFNTTAWILQERLLESLQWQLHDRLEYHMHQLFDLYEVHQTSMLQSMNDRMNDMFAQQQRDYKKWAHQLSEQWQQHLDTIQQQQSSWQRQQQESLNLLKETVAQTTHSLQPLLGLETWLQRWTRGYSWVVFVLYVLGSLNMVWLVTRPKCCQRVRSWLFGMVWMEACVELLLMGLVHSLLLHEAERVHWVVELRRGLLLVGCCIYVLGLVYSLFRPPRNNAESSENEEHYRNAALAHKLEATVRQSQILLERQQEAALGLGHVAPTGVPTGRPEVGSTPSNLSSKTNSVQHVVQSAARSVPAFGNMMPHDASSSMQSGLFYTTTSLPVGLYHPAQHQHHPVVTPLPASDSARPPFTEFHSAGHISPVVMVSQNSLPQDPLVSTAVESVPMEVDQQSPSTVAGNKRPPEEDVSALDVPRSKRYRSSSE